jgi:RNA polymerase sigma-70 factor (ECF subfamily)
MTSAEETNSPSNRSAFVTTHWSVVMSAAENRSVSGQAALEQLCSNYWYPLYVYVRRAGNGMDEAQDLTQAFFARLLEKGYLAHANPQRGKFRTFLLTSLQRFLINEWGKLRAEKRGGRAAFVVWDEGETESRYLAESPSAQTPEQLFEKRWALTLLEQVLATLQTEFAAAGKLQQFELLKVLLWGDKTAPPYSEVAAQMGLSEGALKVAVHRLRLRYRELLRKEVAQTVETPEEVDEELRHLIAVISS